MEIKIRNVRPTIYFSGVAGPSRSRERAEKPEAKRQAKRKKGKFKSPEQQGFVFTSDDDDIVGMPTSERQSFQGWINKKLII